MRIYSKKAFEFENSEGKKVNVRMMDFADVPDWVAKNPMFKLALKAEEIVVVDNKKDEKKAELKANEASNINSSEVEAVTEQTAEESPTKGKK